MIHGMRLEFLGTGTSTGVPQIGCACDVCTSVDKRDNRTRCSVWLRTDNASIVIDTGPDFRAQCLRSGIDRVDAVLFTHFHADHIFGIDDLRLFNFLQKKKIPIYVPDFMVDRFMDCFGYTVNPPIPALNRPRFELNIVTDAMFPLFGLTVEPVNIYHGGEKVKGYVITGDAGRIAYLTDCKRLPPETVTTVTGSDVTVLTALWKLPKTHPAHMNLDEALALSSELRCRSFYLSHITHQMGRHAETDATLPDNVQLAYDGLVVTLPPN